MPNRLAIPVLCEARLLFDSGHLVSDKSIKLSNYNWLGSMFY